MGDWGKGGGGGVVGYIYIGSQAKIKMQKKHIKLDIYINR